MIITPAQTTELVDKTCALYNSLLGTSASGYGVGDGTFGASAKVNDIANIVTGSTDSTFRDINLQSSLSGGVRLLQGSISIAAMLKGAISSFFSALSTTCSQAYPVSTTISDIDTYMTYYNTGTGGPWLCMASPEWVTVYNAIKGFNPTPSNVYCPVTQGTLYPNGMGSFNTATSTFTAPSVTGLLVTGGAIDTTKYAGGFPFVQWSGATGAGTCVITVSGLDQNGVARTYTASVTFGASSTGIALTPSAANCLLTKVTGITATGFTAGTLYVEARPPSGRTYPVS